MKLLKLLPGIALSVAVATLACWLESLLPGAKPKRLFLQSFVDRDTVLFAGLSAPEAETTQAFAKILEPFAETVTVRNP